MWSAVLRQETITPFKLFGAMESNVRSHVNCFSHNDIPRRANLNRKLSENVRKTEIKLCPSKAVKGGQKIR
jgi:hypothetical protein